MEQAGAAEQADCIFCRIANKRLDGVTFVAESDRAVIIKDRAPVAATHLLVISKVHVPDITDQGAIETNDEQQEPVSAVLHLARSYAKRKLPNGFRIVINTGGDAGQTVKHFHAHVLGGEKLKDL